MKCLLFIFTLCSIGGFIYVQGQNEPVLNIEGQYESIQNSDSNSPSGDSQTESRTYEDGAEPQYEESSSSSFSSSVEGQEKPGKLSPKATYLNPMYNEKSIKQREEAKRLFALEMEAGDQADLIGQNEHIRQNNFYDDLGRRSVPQDLENIAAEKDDYLTPEKAPPELVLLVAKESALLGPGKDTDLGSDIDQKKILRSGDYWNGVWKEEVKPKSAMRSGTQKKNLGSIKAKINQGTELYKVVSQMKEISPKLLYIINKKQL